MRQWEAVTGSVGQLERQWEAAREAVVSERQWKRQWEAAGGSERVSGRQWEAGRGCGRQ